MPEKYECPMCGGTGSQDDEGKEGCEDCDSLGITALDCPSCGREAVPIHETTFVAATGHAYCQPCGDRELERIAARRGREKW